ncbi:MAG TPA: chemotaxis protein CheW [Chthoniobacterales bacterium]
MIANSANGNLANGSVPTAEAGRPNDCWNKIGIWGNRQCPVLKGAVHCRNCGVYSSAAGHRLEQEVPPAYMDHWTEHFARAGHLEDEPTQGILIFRIGAEWLGLSPHSLQEIAVDRPIHTVPQLRNKAVLGVVNIGGELLICVTLAELLGLENIAPNVPGPRRTIYRRLFVAVREGSRFVFPVDEVRGLRRFSPSELQQVPWTGPKAPPGYIRGLLPCEGQNVGCLDGPLLFLALERTLA